jgi:carbonic anhydrase
VPSNQIVGLMPGEVFVHRNVANQVIHSDLNCLSTIQFAVDVLAVRHVIVCGHYGCGGVAAALRGERHGLVDNWLRHLEDLAEAHRGSLESLGDDTSRLRLLATLNVVQQVVNVAQTTILQDAWERDQAVTIHGWIYGLEDGLLRDLGVSVQRGSDVQDVAQAAFGRLAVLEGGVVAT